MIEETALTQILKERKDRLAEKVIPSSFGRRKNGVDLIKKTYVCMKLSNNKKVKLLLTFY